MGTHTTTACTARAELPINIERLEKTQRTAAKLTLPFFRASWFAAEKTARSGFGPVNALSNQSMNDKDTGVEQHQQGTS